MYIHIEFGKDDRETNLRIQKVTDEVREGGFSNVVSFKGETLISINCIGDVSLERKIELKSYLERSYPWVINILFATTKFRLLDRRGYPEEFRVCIDGHQIGGRQIFIIAGPCIVQSEDQILEVAKRVKQSGAHALRGGAYKPRSSVWSDSGLGQKALEYLARARDATGLPIVTEVMSEFDVDVIAEYADIIQIGMRNARNFALLKKVASTNKPILYKRGDSQRIGEWLENAEYLVKDNPRVILCCRGTVTNDITYLRNRVDLDDMVVTRSLTHYPVAYDPSHACGDKNYVETFALMAVMGEADGIMIEVDPDPLRATCDSKQQLTLDEFDNFMKKARLTAEIVGRTI